MLKIISSNLGNALLSAYFKTFSLSKKRYAAEIKKTFLSFNPDIILAQEAWSFGTELFAPDFKFVGTNDYIAINKNFGAFDRDTFRTYSGTRKMINVNGKKMNIATGFDVISVEVILNEPITPSDKTERVNKLVLYNVHLVSDPFNPEERARQLRSWILEDFEKRIKSHRNADISGGLPVIIGGDFNFDENRNPHSEDAIMLQNLKNKLDLADVYGEFFNSRGNSMFIPLVKRRYDHILIDKKYFKALKYRQFHPLGTDGFIKLKRKRPLTYFLHFDHQSIFSIIESNNESNN